MAALLMTAGDQTGTRYVIDRPVFTIGRGSNSDVQLTDERASRAHARIRVDGARYILEDLQGRIEMGGGTYVNERPVQWHVLAPGDEIRIADVRLVYEADAEPVRAPSPPPPAPPPPMSSESRDVPIVQHIDGTDLKRSIMGASDGTMELARLHERLLVFYEIANAISTQLDEKDVIEAIVDALLRVFRQSARVAVLSIDPRDGKLVTRSERTREGALIERFPITRKVMKEVLEDRRAVIFGGVGAGSVSGMMLNSMMCAPLVVRGEVLGAIHITSKDAVTAFTGPDLDLLVGISAQAAIALKNADLYAELVGKERLRYDVEVAQEIQRRFLPRGAPRVDGWSFASEYKPANAIGGDFYDFIPLGLNRLGVLIGDVSGKGMSGALLMARVTSEFRWAAVTCREPRDVMALVNSTLVAASYEGLYVAATYATVDVGVGIVTICNAGSLRPLVRRFGPEGNALEVIDAADAPLGVVDDTVFSQARFSLEGGDLVLLTTDGIVESTDPQKRELGSMPVEELVRRGAGNAEATVEDLTDLVRRYVAGGPQNDDLTMVAFGRDLPAHHGFSHDDDPPPTRER